MGSMMKYIFTFCAVVLSLTGCRVGKTHYFYVEEVTSGGWLSVSKYEDPEELEALTDSAAWVAGYRKFAVSVCANEAVSRAFREKYHVESDAKRPKDFKVYKITGTVRQKDYEDQEEFRKRFEEVYIPLNLDPETLTKIDSSVWATGKKTYERIMES